MLTKWKWYLLALGVFAAIIFSFREEAVIQQAYDYYPPVNSRNVVAVLLHGGSWQAGGREQLFWVGNYLANRGVSVINMSYRLAPSYQFDAPIQDIAQVVAGVEQDPDAFGVQQNFRLVVLGFSAGGHLAAQFCTTETDYNVRQADVCVGLAGIYDLERVVEGKDGPLLVSAVRDFLGDADARVASPLHRVKSGESTQFLLFWGENDTVVAREQMILFDEALRQKEVEVVSVVVPEADHISIFSTIPDDDPVGRLILETILVDR